MSDLIELIHSLPKSELHVHIEGTLEPDLMMVLADRNSVSLPYQTQAEIIQAYDFKDLQSFLDLYYLGANVLKTEEDFYDLMMAYFLRCKEDGVEHTEMMFDPQTHTKRGIDFSVFMNGFSKARETAFKEMGISSELIMSFLRHLDEQSAIDTLMSAEQYADDIIAVGLDSSELGNPPSKFEKVFSIAKEQGYKLVAHAGEEGPPSYIEEALELLHVDRVDHGVRAMEDKKVINQLAKLGTPITVCPLSNVRLRVFDDMSQHPLLAMLDAGLNVCVNSDDPAYFGGYIMDNFRALAANLELNEGQARDLIGNGISGSFMSDDRKRELLKRVHNK